MLIKHSKFILIIFVVCLIVGGIFYFSNNQEGNEVQPQATPNLKLLNSHSHPEAREEWVVSFETEGKADLTITPQDPDTIDDLDFITLTCNGEERTPQFLANDIISYSNWQCEGTGKLTHFVNIARKHTLKFTFGNLAAFAYNNPDSVTDSFTDTSKVSATSSVVITGGQATLESLKSNGESCSSGGECESTHCVDGYCCDTDCGGECDRCDVGGSLGTCTDVDSDCAGSDASCYCNGGTCQACAACNTCSSYSCNAITTNWGAGTYSCAAGSSDDPNRCYNGACINCGGWGNAGYCWYSGCNNSCTATCSTHGGVYNNTCDWIDDPTDCSTALHFYPGYTCVSEIYYGPMAYTFENKAYYHKDGEDDCNYDSGSSLICRQCACNN